MKKNFFGGMLSGIICTIMIVVLIGCGKDLKDIFASAGSQMGGNSQQSTDLDIKTSDIQEKMDTITKVLDYYYYKDIDKEDLINGLYKGLVDGVGDPYTVYYTPEEYKDFKESSDGVYAGLGASVTTDKNGNIQIVKPFKDGPADKAGIKPGDILTKIDGEDSIGMDLSTAVTKIKGEAGTIVKLEIYRDGKYLNFEVTRGYIEVPTVEYKMLEGNIGYIAVSSFDDVTTNQFIGAVDDLTEQGMVSLIVDLRDNPGGLLSAVTDMLSRIVPKGDLLVYMEDKYGNKETYKSTSKETVEVPIAVLINGNSASASEVFSGCLQSYGLAALIGTQSFGKGIVQTIVPLDDGSAIKVTISSYYTPSDVCIHGIGLTPDVKVELTEETSMVGDLEVDNQVQAAIDYLKGKTK